MDEAFTPAPVPQFYGIEIFEHYQQDGYLLIATTDASALRLEPGDFIVKRMWSTAVAPYIYNSAQPVIRPVEGGAS